MPRNIIFYVWLLILVFINSALAQEEVRIGGGSLEIPKLELPEGHQVLSKHSNPSITESIIISENASKAVNHLAVETYITIPNTTHAFLTTLTNTSINSTYSYITSTPSGQPAPPSFISHITVSVSAPSNGGNPTVVHGIVVASNAVPGTYNFVVEYQFWNGPTFLGLDWISVYVNIRATATEISGETLQFGDVLVGTSAQRTFSVTNKISRTLFFQLRFSNEITDEQLEMIRTGNGDGEF